MGRSAYGIKSRPLLGAHGFASWIEVGDQPRTGGIFFFRASFKKNQANMRKKRAGLLFREKIKTSSFSRSKDPVFDESQTESR